MFADNNIDKGATFTISIPLSEIETKNNTSKGKNENADTGLVIQ
jgi:hypothetical protein